MPINIPKLLPASAILKQENIFVMDEEQAVIQDIRPLNILILNLMPEKQKVETQLLRLLGNTPLQVNITFLRTATYQSKHTSQLHLEQFYENFETVKNKKFDGFIITGAPVEQMAFHEVDYWEELKIMMDWSKEAVTSTLHICWGAQAALYHHFGLEKETLPSKCFGIYSHTVDDRSEKLLRGFDDVFYAPHSRHTDVSLEKIENHHELKLLASSKDAGAFIMLSNGGKQIMVTGHLEYIADTLAEEYRRDVEKGLDTPLPFNYFPKNDAKEQPRNFWRSHAHLLFSNWLNYYVYQETPYQWE